MCDIQYACINNDTISKHNLSNYAILCCVNKKLLQVNFHVNKLLIYLLYVLMLKCMSAQVKKRRR